MATYYALSVDSLTLRIVGGLGRVAFGVRFMVNR